MIDWAMLGEETVENLRRYLMVDTTNPPGNEAAGAAFLSELLAREGIAATVEESTPGRANVMARVRGEGALGGLVLHHHIDVVYADRRYWSVDPFGGVIQDGYLYGRGALDMKSIGMVQTMAVVALKRAGVSLTRDPGDAPSWLLRFGGLLAIIAAIPGALRLVAGLFAGGPRSR